jgi:hypothetical protein
MADCQNAEFIILTAERTCHLKFFALWDFVSSLFPRSRVGKWAVFRQMFLVGLGSEMVLAGLHGDPLVAHSKSQGMGACGLRIGAKAHVAGERASPHQALFRLQGLLLCFTLWACVRARVWFVRGVHVPLYYGTKRFQPEELAQIR